jgi:predicted nucleic acid-binding Zn ribbon protein
VVDVDGSAWLYELTLRKKMILGKLAGKFGKKDLKNIRFRIGDIKNSNQ